MRCKKACPLYPPKADILAPSTRAATGQPARITAYTCFATHCLGDGRAHHLAPSGAWLAHITLGVYGHLFGNSDDMAADPIVRAFGKVLTENTTENSARTK